MSAKASTRRLTNTLEAAYQVLSGHHAALGHDYEPLGLKRGSCVGCRVLRRIERTLNKEARGA